MKPSDDTTNQPLNQPTSQPIEGAYSPQNLPPIDSSQPVGMPTDQPLQPVQSQAGNQAAVPSVAEDNDRIEPEWIDRAKRIVSQTRQDPYNQTKQLSAFKAEYLKKRYNKDIRAVEG